MALDLIDTHCHLDWEPLSGQIDAVLARAAEAGVDRCITVGISLASSRACIALAERYPQVAAVVGIHPEEAGSVTQAALDELAQLADHPKVVALGEIGLDYYWMKDPPDVQRAAFERLIGVAAKRSLPLVIHCRDGRAQRAAYDDLISVLRASSGGKVSGVLHCVSGPADYVESALAMGMHVSFSGTVTFPNAKETQALSPLVPDDRLLVETDSPFLAPQAVRGKTNEPAFVAHTCAFLATFRGTTPEALALQTSRNARRLFRLPQP